MFADRALAAALKPVEAEQSSIFCPKAMRHISTLAIFAAVMLSLLAGCGGGDKPATVDPTGEIGRQVSYSLPASSPDVLAALPKNAKGEPILIATPKVQITYDASRKTQINAIAACTGWIASCYKPGEREIDDCARSVPVCQTETPWLETGACCPSACFDKYRAARLAGRPSANAVIDNYINDASCFPLDVPIK